MPTLCADNALQRVGTKPVKLPQSVGTTGGANCRHLPEDLTGAVATDSVLEDEGGTAPTETCSSYVTNGTGFRLCGNPAVADGRCADHAEAREVRPTGPDTTAVSPARRERRR
jgi:hypothetical protein